MKMHSLAFRLVVGAGAISSASVGPSVANMPSENGLPVSAIGALIEAVPGAAEQLRRDDRARRNIRKTDRPTIYFAVSSISVIESKDSKIKQQNQNAAPKRDGLVKKNTLPPGPAIQPPGPPIKPPMTGGPAKN